MPSPDTPYEHIDDSLCVLDYEKELEFEEEKWVSRLYITETLGKHYKLFIKTKVINKSTEKEREKESYSMLLKKRGWTARKILGYSKYKKKGMPVIQTQIRSQVKKLAEENKTMKTEEELVEEVSQKFKNQLNSVDFEKAVNEVRE